MSLTVGKLVAKFGLDAKGFMAGMNAVSNKVKSTSDKVAAAASKMNVFKLKLIGVAIAAWQVGKALTSMIRDVQSLNRTMVVVEGSAEEAVKTWGLMNKTAKQLGISVATLSRNYIALTSAAKGSKLSQKDLQALFVALSKKAAVLALTNDQVARTFRAVSDMASSGVITMQDLRLQLAQAMPGAMQTMAAALDVTVVKLKELVATGQLAAEDVFPLFTRQLEKETAEGVKTLGTGLRTTVAGLSSAFFNFKKVLADSIITDALRLIIKTMEIGLDVISLFGKSTNLIWNGFKGFVTWFAKSVTSGEMDTLGTLGIDLGNLKKTVAAVNEATTEVGDGLKEQEDNIKKLTDNSKATLEAWEDEVTSAFKSVLNEFTSFVSDLATGVDVSFTKMINNMAKGILDFAMEMLVVKPLLDWFRTWLKDINSGGGGGGIVASILGMLGKPTAMADGGIINEPVLGIGAHSKSGYLIGEAGPEAVVPLGNGGGSSGGGTNNINVTINALDSKSVSELMRDNPQAITGPLVEAIKGGNRGLASSLRLAVN